MDANILSTYLPGTVAGKNILITGGSTGIGRAAALLLANLGANVLIVGHDPQHLEAALNDISKTVKNSGQGAVSGVLADLATEEGINSVFSEADHVFGGTLDVFVNNAALAADGVKAGDFSEWDRVVKTNMLAYIACARYAADRMEARKSGHIVNIGSLSADSKSGESTVYVATKTGTRGFSVSLGKELNKLGIKVSLIEPGLVGTDMPEVPAEEQPEKEEKKEMLKAEDIAAAIYYVLIQPGRCDISELKIRPHLQNV